MYIAVVSIRVIKFFPKKPDIFSGINDLTEPISVGRHIPDPRVETSNEILGWSRILGLVYDGPFFI